MFNIPNLEPLYEEVAAYVREHQGEKGYIDCQPSLNGDIIYGIVYDDFSRMGLEKPYYPVFRDRLGGFTPRLCILDLLFNEGPSSIRWLKQL